MLDASQRRNRLTGSTNYPAWGLQENYDRYGNRLSQVAISGCTGQSCPQPSVSVDVTTNRVTGSPYAYDANGNMTNDGLNTLVYDAENRALSATNGSSSGTYTYDGNNLRVKKASGSTTTVYIFGGSRVIAEYDNGAAPTAPSREYVYGGSALLAKIDSSGTKYYHQDQLSNRLVTSSAGATVAQLGHFPYGEAWYNATNDKLVFTSYERDSESGNDYAIARYYISRLARFSSPDIQSGSTANPQSLNRYSYVLNNPGGLVDPSGQCGENIETRRLRERLYYRQGGRELDYEELAEFLGLQDPPPTNGCQGNNGGEGDSGGGGWDGGGWGGFDFGDGSSGSGCTVEGMPVPCNLVGSLAGMGAAVQCPNNACTTSGGGQIWRFSASTNGNGAYFPVEGPGWNFPSEAAALVAGALWAAAETHDNGIENCGMTYSTDNGQYSFTGSIEGQLAICQPLSASSFVPSGATPDGGYHSHPNDPDYYHERFSGQQGDYTDPFGNPARGGDVGWSQGTNLPSGFPISLGTPEGRVIIYYPTNGCQVFVTGSPAGTGTTIPICQ